MLKIETFQYKGRAVPKFRVCDMTDLDREDEAAGCYTPRLTYTREWLEYQAQKRTERRIKEAGLPGDIQDFSFDSYQGTESVDNIRKLRTFVDKFSKKKYRTLSLYLWSKANSTQKSTTAKIVAKELLLKDYSVHFTLMADLVNALKEESFRPDDENLHVYLDRCRTSDFLVIDDAFDAKKTTMYKSGYQVSFIDAFLRKRIEQDRLSTCFTSNTPPSQVKDSFSLSIQTLIERSAYPMEFRDVIGSFEISGFMGRVFD